MVFARGKGVGPVSRVHRASTSFNKAELRLLSAVFHKAVSHPDFSVLLTRAEGRSVNGKVRRMLERVVDREGGDVPEALPSAGNPWGFSPQVVSSS